MLRKRYLKVLLVLQKALNEETDLTRDMLNTYFLYIRGETSEEELKTANIHLKKLLKDLGFGLLASMPFSPITIPLIAKLAKKYEVDIIPNWFKEPPNK